MPGYKNDTGPVKNDGRPAGSDYCCTCGPITLKNCNCRRVEWRGVVFGDMASIMPDTDDQDIYFDFIDFNDYYTFYYEQPFLVALFMANGTKNVDFVENCTCVPITDLDDDGDCGLVCQIDNTYSDFTSPCMIGNTCFSCQSMGPAFSLLPNDTVGKTYGDPCIYTDATGYGTVPGKCFSIDDEVPIPGGENCCEFGGAYEMEHDAPGIGVCAYGWDFDMRCITPWTLYDDVRKTDPPFCGPNGFATIEVFVDRGFFGTGVDIAPCWVALLRMNTWHKDSVGSAFLGIERKFWYRGGPLPSKSSMDSGFDVACVMTQGFHTLTLVHTHGDNSDYSGLGDYEWCTPPGTIQILAHGAAPDGPYW